MHSKKLCKCGCEEEVKNRFVSGHNIRMIDLSRVMKKRWRNNYTKMLNSVGSKECLQKKSDTMKLKYQDPEFKKKQDALVLGCRKEAAKTLSNYLRSNPAIMQARLKYMRSPAACKKQGLTMKAQYASGERKPTYEDYRYEQGWINTKKGGRIFYHSSWEKFIIKLLDSSPLVKKFAYEPFGIPYKYDGDMHTYFPDFLVTLCNGDKYLLELKGQVGKGYKDKNKFKAAQKYCDKRDIQYIVIKGHNYSDILKNPRLSLITDTIN